MATPRSESRPIAGPNSPDPLPSRKRRIGIFTKMDMAGGSEFRAVELANEISRANRYESVLLVPKGIPDRLKVLIAPEVELHHGVFTSPNIEPFYSLDHLLVINSDSRAFTTADYWLGLTESQPHAVEITRIKSLSFLFNFIVSPSCNLTTLLERVRDIRIITANRKFFDEIGKQERYEPVRHLPRLRLESPINIALRIPKTTAIRTRLGMHSLPNKSKWNSQWPELIRRVNSEFGGSIAWDFMGMPKSIRSEIEAENVIFRPEFLLPVEEFLKGLDIFVFFLDWKREEPWARSAGEALMSGCPVITTARGGNRDQVIHGNTGFLCDSLDEFVDACRKLLEAPLLLSALQRNALRESAGFSSQNVVRRLLNFLE